MCLSWQGDSFLIFWLAAFVSSWGSVYWLSANEGTSGKLFLGMSLLPLYFFMTSDDDIYRYLSEGHMLLSGLNPYEVSPEMASMNLVDSSLVNHSDWTAIYGPVYLYLFMLIAWIGGGVYVMKAVWLLLHLLNVYLFKRTINKDVAILYCFSPFILFETIGQGHLEQLLVTGVLLMVLGAKFSSTKCMSLGILIGCWVKWWLLPALPLVIRKPNLKALSLFFVGSIFLLFPFVDSSFSILDSLLDFRELWSCGYPYLWACEILGDHWGRVSIVIFLLLIGGSVLLLGGNLSEQIWQLFRWSLFFAPTLHPWYFVFPLSAALCSNKKTTFLVIGVLAMGLHHPEFYVRAGEGWVSNWIYSLPLFMALFFSEWRLRHHFFLQKGETTEQFTVVTPVLNEESNLREIGRQINLMNESIQDWIVVDAGSTDNSVEVAKEMGAKVFSPGVKGRGEQIHFGTNQAKSDWVIVIHADTRMPFDFFGCLKFHISRVPNLDGGAFKMAYRNYEHMGPLHWLNDLKFRLFGVSFGDQSQFFNRKSLKNRGGFPKLGIMEDLELSLIWKGGHVAFISETKSLTSPRRWKKVGRLSNTIQIIKLLVLYLFARHWNTPVDVRKLYQRYYS